MMLLFLFLLLVVPYLLLALLDRATAFRIRPNTRARVGLSLFFIFTAIGHFVRAEEMSQMLPPSVPYRIEIIFLTGVLEILGAIGVWIAPLMKLTGFCLILMLICFLPANIYSAMNRAWISAVMGRSGLFTGSSSVPVIRDLVDLLCNQAAFVGQRGTSVSSEPTRKLRRTKDQQ